MSAIPPSFPMTNYIPKERVFAFLDKYVKDDVRSEAISELLDILGDVGSAIFDDVKATILK